MPRKRSSSAARGDSAQRPQAQASSATNDIFGVVLMVVAVALLVSLAMPSGAVVTHAVERALTSLFGVGAILAPITILLFSLTFFVDRKDVIEGRAALGLLLVSVAILGSISLFVPGAEEAPDLVLAAETAEAAGGYVGGGVAWVLLTLVGRWVGVVLLAGIALTGVIVCGFSVSGFIVSMQRASERVSEARATARAERTQLRQMAYAEPDAPAQAQPIKGKGRSRAKGAVQAAAEAASYIGERKTSVLRRRKHKRDEAQTTLPWDEADEASLAQDISDAALSSAKTVRRQRQSAPAPQGAPAPTEPVVPDFLRSPKTRTEAPARPDQTPGRTEDSAGAPAAAAPKRQPKKQPKQQATKRKRQATGKAGAAPQQKARPKAAQKAAPAAPAAATGDRRPAREGQRRPGEGAEGYELPPMSLLTSNPNSALTASSSDELDETRSRLQGTLHEFGLRSRVVDYVSGPIVTTFRVEMGEGERVNRIRNLEDDIALTLAAEKVRIFAPIPGTSFVGIEIPNKTRQNVQLGDVLPYASGGPLEVAIGRDSSGMPVVADIQKMPHMLVAGTTGSGKSVMVNSMIMSLLMRTTPKQVRLIMIDPKRVEFSCYNGLPHLYVPVVTEPRQAASALQWAVSEMERRLKVFERAGAREIGVYNRMCTSGKLSEMENPPEPMPFLVVIIDELSDLMMVAGKDVEASIVRIAQLARAAGIHLIIATQRPSANVVTGLIKSNIDNRVALKVSSGIDSRVILDETGAERLLGNGDMLFKYRGLNMQRVLGCYTSDAEINEVVDFIRAQAEPDYHEEILSAVVPGQMTGGAHADLEEEDDPLVWEAAQIVVESRLGSTSGLQRRLKVGYARAGRIMDMLEAKGVVGPPDGSKPREVLLDEDGLEELRVLEAQFREVV